MWQVALIVGALLCAAGCEGNSAASPTSGRAAPTKAKTPAPTPKPNVTPMCSMTFTAPNSYTRDFTAGDYCVLNTISTPVILFEPHKPGVGGDVIADRDLSVRVDPAIAAGATVTLTGTQADQVQFQYSEGTIETRCFWFSGTATVVTQRPNLDVTFDATCMSAGSPANGMHLKGEFKSTL